MAFKEWYAGNRERQADRWRDWYAANAEARAKYWVKWSAANPGVVGKISARRRGALLRAMPAWADAQAINAIYAKAARLTRETGVPHQVDHIYPLQGKVVCGLHCEANLQILTKSANIRKRNKMPDEVSDTGPDRDRRGRYIGRSEGMRLALT